MSMRRRSLPRDYIYATYLLLNVLFFSSNAMAASKVVVFYYDKTAGPVVRLDRVAPMSDGLRAILAMYALQNGTGCTGGVDTLTCALVDALRLGAQCSNEHLELVRAWFKTTIPKMSGAREAIYKDIQAPEALENICYRMPPGSSYLNDWDIIRVTANGNRVLIDAHGLSSVREEAFGTFRYVTEYEIAQGSVKVISHREIPARRKD